MDSIKSLRQLLREKGEEIPLRSLKVTNHLDSDTMHRRALVVDANR
jgi:hypothetical protein